MSKPIYELKDKSNQPIVQFTLEHKIGTEIISNVKIVNDTLLKRYFGEDSDKRIDSIIYKLFDISGRYLAKSAGFCEYGLLFDEWVAKELDLSTNEITGRLNNYLNLVALRHYFLINDLSGSFYVTPIEMDIWGFPLRSGWTTLFVNKPVSWEDINVFDA